MYLIPSASHSSSSPVQARTIGLPRQGVPDGPFGECLAATPPSSCRQIDKRRPPRPPPPPPTPAPLPPTPPQMARPMTFSPVTTSALSTGVVVPPPDQLGAGDFVDAETPACPWCGQNHRWSTTQAFVEPGAFALSAAR